MDGAVISPGLLFGLGLFTADGWGQIFPKWPPPEKHTLMNIPERSASNVLPPLKATITPVFPGDPLRNSVKSNADFYGASALAWDLVHVKVCVHLSRMESPFPPDPLSPCTQSPLAFNVIAPGVLSSSAKSPGVGTWHGAQNSLL